MTDPQPQTELHISEETLARAESISPNAPVANLAKNPNAFHVDILDFTPQETSWALYVNQRRIISGDVDEDSISGRRHIKPFELKPEQHPSVTDRIELRTYDDPGCTVSRYILRVTPEPRAQYLFTMQVIVTVKSIENGGECVHRKFLYDTVPMKSRTLLDAMDEILVKKHEWLAVERTMPPDTTNVEFCGAFKS